MPELIGLIIRDGLMLFDLHQHYHLIILFLFLVFSGNVTSAQSPRTLRLCAKQCVTPMTYQDQKQRFTL
jgi:hypothetical protein